MKLCLCMIVKNEEKYIRTCLESAFTLVDNAVIVDTGSTDNTKDIIKEFGDRITLLEYEWKNDFADARNVSLESAQGEWILVLDADQKLICNPIKLKEILENINNEGLTIPAYNLLDNNEIIYSTEHFNLFKNRGYRYKNSIHECINVENNNNGNYIIDTEIAKIIHYGYLKENVNDKNKTMRNISILEKEYEKNNQDPFICYNLGVSHSSLGEYNKALEYFIKCHGLSKGIGLTLYYNDMLAKIAECLYNLHKYDECINYIKDVVKVEIWNNFVDLYFIMGNCYYIKKDYELAVQAFTRCIKIGENKQVISVLGRGSFISKIMLARICAIQNKSNEATVQYIESVFDKNNFNKYGLEEARTYFIKNNMQQILIELNRLVGER